MSNYESLGAYFQAGRPRANYEKKYCKSECPFLSIHLEFCYEYRSSLRFSKNRNKFLRCHNCISNNKIFDNAFKDFCNKIKED